MAFTQVTVTGTYRTPSGSPAAGTVVFTPSFAMRNGDTTVAKPTTGVLGSAGQLSVTLAATTDPGTAPLGGTYLVQEYITGVPAIRSYRIAVPHTFPTLDLESAPLTEQTPTVAPFPTPGPPPTLELGTVTAVGPTGTPDVDVVEIPTEYGGRYRLDFVLQQGPQGDPSVPIDGSVTNAKVATNAAIVADKLVDGITLKVLTAAERTKLAGIAAGATVNDTDAALRARAGHTGTQPIASVTGLQAELDAKAAAAGIPEQVRDTIAAALVAGANVTITVDDGADTITVAAPTPAPVTLTDAATVALDAAAGTLFRLAMGGNRTIAAPSNPVDGKTITLEVTAVSAARTLSLTTGAGGFSFGTTVTALSATTSGTTDFVEATYRASVDRWRVRAYQKGLTP